MLPIFDQNLRRLQRREERIELLRHRRELRDNSNPFELADDRFIELYRLNKDSARYIFDILNLQLVDGVYRNSIPNFIKFFATLRFYATGSYQRDLGLAYNIGLSQTSIHRCVRQITEGIIIHFSDEITFPITPRDQNIKKQQFMNMYGFPGVLGCIDGTHIAILKPSREHHNFLNRKGYHSLNVQMICDAEMKILNVNSNYPGGSHDSFIWRQSTIRSYLLREFTQNRLGGSWLLGDSGYPLEPFLMVPFVNPPENSPEARYNRAHRSTRNLVERCFGVLKCRFRVLLHERTARYSPDFVASIIVVCAALHNICLRFNVPLIDEPIEEIDDVPVYNPNPVPDNRIFFLREGQNVRNRIVNRYFML